MHINDIIAHNWTIKVGQTHQILVDQRSILRPQINIKKLNPLSIKAYSAFNQHFNITYRKFGASFAFLLSKKDKWALING